MCTSASETVPEELKAVGVVAVNSAASLGYYGLSYFVCAARGMVLSVKTSVKTTSVKTTALDCFVRNTYKVVIAKDFAAKQSRNKKYAN